MISDENAAAVDIPSSSATHWSAIPNPKFIVSLRQWLAVFIFPLCTCLSTIDCFGGFKLHKRHTNVCAHTHTHSSKQDNIFLIQPTLPKFQVCCFLYVTPTDDDYACYLTVKS